MDPAARERRRRELAQFHRLFDLPAGQRDEVLAELEAADAQLGQSVRRLLEAADADREADAAAAVGASRDQSAPAAGGEIVGGRFRTLRLLGLGGMGEVYLAERIDGVEQRVALKRMRGDAPGSAARADRERRILARLTHPNIAALVDTGLSAAGQPWFAMEYVEGEPITAWCDRHALDLTQRARLFAKVCRAVQFAHRNLVLHRDLKPSNILVDAEGRPKLLDFGIAKQLDHTDPQQTQTLALTPAYAAPEQLRGEPATTTSDVYQLGLVLYELTAGVSSRAAREFAPLREELSSILPRVEQALGRLAARDRVAAEQAARRRAASLDKLRRALKGDLGRVVAKATADDPRERYDTAQMLADDLERWAERLPVAAHRGSYAYRLRKLVRRHAVAAAAIVLLALGLVGVSAFALQRARSEGAQRARAEQQTRRAEATVEFLRNLVSQNDPQQTGGAKLSADDLLARAARELDQRKDLDAVTRGVLSREVAAVFSLSGHLDDARRYAEQSLTLLEPDREQHAAEYLQALAIWSQAQTDAGRFQVQVDAIDRTLPLAKRTPDGPYRWYPLLLHLRGGALAELGREKEGEEDIRSSLDMLGADAPDEAAGVASNDLAILLESRGELREALSLHRRSAASGATRLNTLVARTSIGSVQRQLGETRAAATELEATLAQSEALLGPDHGNVRAVRQVLALTYQNLGDYAKARAVFDRAAVESAQQTWPEWIKLSGRAIAARLDLDALKPDLALPQLQALSEELRVQKSKLWHTRVDSLLGEALLRSDRCEEALPVLARAEAQARRLLGGRAYPTLGEIADSRGRCLLLARDWDGARAQFAAAATQFETSQRAGSASVLRSQLHGLWAEALATRDPSVFARMRAKRAALAAELGNEDVVPLWQLDLLLDALGRELGQPGLDPARRRRAEDGLMALAGTPQPPRFVGLNGFF